MAPSEAIRHEARGRLTYLTLLVTGSRLLHRIAPGSMERVNVSIQNQIEQGTQIINKAGGVSAYDEPARTKGGAEGPDAE